MQIKEPQKFILAAVVKKNSKTGISSNKRLLVIKKGNLYYYSNPPKGFNGDPKFLDNYTKQLPKCMIEISNIRHINGYEQNSSYFSIEFDAKNMLQQDDIRKTKMLEQYNFAPKNTKEVITWQFTCDNQFVKQRWVSSLKALNKYYANQKHNIHKYFENIHHKKDDEVSNPSMRSSMKLPWNEDPMKKSNSNQNLSKRKSQLSSSPNTYQRKSKSPHQKSERSSQSQNRQIPKQSLKSSESNEDLVKNFMMLEKVQEKPQTDKVQPIEKKAQEKQEIKKQEKRQMQVVEQVHESAFVSPQKTQQFEEQKIQALMIQHIPPETPNIEQKPPIQTMMKKKHSEGNRVSLIKHQICVATQMESASYYESQYFSLNRNCSFNQRIQAQKRFNQLIGTFGDYMLGGMMQHINDKKYGNSRNEIRGGDGLSILKVSDIRYKIGYVSTQALVINKKKKIYYNEEICKGLKKEMKAYNRIWQRIIHQIKSNKQTQIDHRILRIRLPLCMYAEYKGVCALGFSCQEQSKQNELEKEELTEWKQLISKLGFNPANFTLKKITVQNAEHTILYIKQVKNIYKQNPVQKNHQVTFEPPLNSSFLLLQQKQKTSTSTSSLLKYLNGIKSIQDNQIFTTCTKEEIVTTLQYCYFCKYLRKIYRAAQGEIDELHFMNLLLRGDEQLNLLFQSAGFQKQEKHKNAYIMGVFFEFVKYYLGINCEIDEERVKHFGSLKPLGINSKVKENQQNLVLSVTVKPRICGYRLETLQLYESFENIDKYLSEKNLPLCHRSLELKQSTYTDNQYQESLYPDPCILSTLYSTSQLHFIQNDYLSCIKCCKEYLSLASPSDENTWHTPAPTNCFNVYLLMLNAYAQFSHDNFKVVFKEAAESIIWGFGQNVSLLVEVFMLGAMILKNDPEGEKLLQMAKKLSQNSQFHSNIEKISELNLTLAAIHYGQGKTQEAQQLYESARRMIEKQGTRKQKLQLYINQLKNQLSPYFTSPSIQKCHHIIDKIKEIMTNRLADPMAKEFLRLLFQVGYKYDKNQLCEEGINGLWELRQADQIYALQSCAKLAFKIGYRFEIKYLISMMTLQQALLILSEKKNAYNGVWEMFLQAFSEKDEELLEPLFQILPQNTLIQLSKN